MLQALKEEPPLNAKCKDKFLIQSTLLTPEKEARGSAEIVRVGRFPHYLLILTHFSSGQSPKTVQRLRKFTSRN